MPVHNLTAAQYNELITLVNPKVVRPAPGHTAYLGEGLTIGNNTDLDNAVRNGKGYAVDTDGKGRGAAFVRYVLTMSSAALIDSSTETAPAW